MNWLVKLWTSVDTTWNEPPSSNIWEKCFFNFEDNMGDSSCTKVIIYQVYVSNFVNYLVSVSYWRCFISVCIVGWTNVVCRCSIYSLRIQGYIVSLIAPSILKDCKPKLSAIWWSISSNCRNLKANRTSSWQQFKTININIWFSKLSAIWARFPCYQITF